MKFGEMKYDVPFEKIKNHHWDFNPLQEFMIELEGKRLYKSHAIHHRHLSCPFYIVYRSSYKMTIAFNH